MNIVIRGDRRQESGKNASRRLRKKGLIPAVIYGEGSEAQPLVITKKDIIHILKQETGENTIFKVALGNKEIDAMIKEIQVDPVTDELLHADLVRISMDKKVRVTVPVVTVGTPVGVKSEGGFIEFITREIEVECLPGSIPENIIIDISNLHLHQTFKVGNIDAQEGITIITDPNTVLVIILAPSKAEVFPGEVPEVAVEEGKEPEVIKKGKVEEETEEK